MRIARAPPPVFVDFFLLLPSKNAELSTPDRQTAQRLDSVAPLLMHRSESLQVPNIFSIIVF
jgi:hypothetical protein